MPFHYVNDRMDESNIGRTDARQQWNSSPHSERITLGVEKRIVVECMLQRSDGIQEMCSTKRLPIFLLLLQVCRLGRR